MAECRELSLNEKRTLIYALAEARTEAYSKVMELRDRSDEMENNGQSGYGALADEAEQYEILADLTDMLVELVCENRLVIRTKEDKA